VQLASGARGISNLRANYSRSLQMLMAIVALVLLIACGNVGNLLLSRAASRQAEMSLRQALGASRMRLVRQLLTESMLLALLGGVGGVLVAQWGVSTLVTFLAKNSPLDVRPDASILAFTFAISLVAGLLFGLVPALRASKTDLSSSLKERTTGSWRSRRGFGLGSALVIAQVGLSMVLLTVAGLFARSLTNLLEENVGFNRDNVLLVDIEARLAGYKPTELGALHQQLLERLRALPGVQAATIATYSPMGGSSRSSSLEVQGYTAQPGEEMDANDLLVASGYCETFGLTLLLGREIGPRDTAAAPKIAVVNEEFAQHFFHGENPLGRRFAFDDKARESLEIVGVVGNMKFSSARERPERMVFRPVLQLQDQSAYSRSVAVRTAGDPLLLAGAVRQAITQVDDKLPISNVTSLRQQLEGKLQQDQLMARLVSFFGLLALMLACVGLYGVMAHGVVRRTNEIGVRMALGAERKNIIWMVLKETLVLVAIGVALGLPTALGASRLVASQLFATNTADPLTLLMVTILLTVVAGVAGFIPARKASRMDPLIALRYE
jgi:predicted permease